MDADKVTLLPYTFTIFVIMTITFYFFALPLSIILLKNMWKHKVYKDKKEYWALYAFIFTNLTNGALIVVVFFHMFLVKRIENSILKKNMELDEGMIEHYRNEVRDALKKAANNVIIALTQEFNYDSYYEPYEQDRYNGD